MRKAIIPLMVMCLSLTACTPEINVGSSISEEEAAANLKEVSSSTDQGEFVFHESYNHATASVTSTENKTVFLYLGEKMYYPVDVPVDIEYVTDNSKYIYAKDGSYSVSVMSGVAFDQFSTTAAISEPQTYSQYVVATKEDSTSTLKESAVWLMNNKAVIARTYNCGSAFNSILQGMLNNSYALTSYESLDYSKATEKYPSYSSDEYTPSVTAGLGDDVQKIYTFDYGTLTIAKELRQFDDACETISIKLAVVADSDIVSSYYNDGELFYVTVGEYFAFVYKLNYNTVYTCFGYGDEAGFNALDFIKNQE